MRLTVQLQVRTPVHFRRNQNTSDGLVTGPFLVEMRSTVLEMRAVLRISSCLSSSYH